MMEEIGDRPQLNSNSKRAFHHGFGHGVFGRVLVNRCWGSAGESPGREYLPSKAGNDGHSLPVASSPQRRADNCRRKIP